MGLPLWLHLLAPDSQRPPPPRHYPPACTWQQHTYIFNAKVFPCIRFMGSQDFCMCTLCCSSYTSKNGLTTSSPSSAESDFSSFSASGRSSAACVIYKNHFSLYIRNLIVEFMYTKKQQCKNLSPVTHHRLNAVVGRRVVHDERLRQQRVAVIDDEISDATTVRMFTNYILYTRKRNFGTRVRKLVK